MPTPTAFVDAKGALHTWLNSLTALVGPGHPIPLGIHFDRLRSPAAGAYVTLTNIGGDDAWTFGSRARISASIWALTQLDADAAAAAYANAIRQLQVSNTSVSGAVFLTSGNISGPLQVSDSDEPHRIVDADFYMIPGP